MVYDVLLAGSALSCSTTSNVATTTQWSSLSAWLAGETLTFAPYKTHQLMKSLMELAQSRHSNAVIASRGVSDPTLRRSYFFCLLYFSSSLFSDLRHCEGDCFRLVHLHTSRFPQFEATFQIRTCAKYRTAELTTNQLTLWTCSFKGVAGGKITSQVQLLCIF